MTKRMKDVIMDIDHIEVANKNEIGQFADDYLPPAKEWQDWIHPTTGDLYTLSLGSPKSMPEATLDACFKIIEMTSSEDYKNSKDGWKPKAKKKEMRLLDMKYIVVMLGSSVQGFVSLMPTYEDGYPVVYCYEIHLLESLRGTGMAQRLMELLEGVAKRIPGTEKTMLTSFVSNGRAVRFYRKLGYDTDEYSPPARMLRDGTKIEPAYIIMSKPVQRDQ